MISLIIGLLFFSCINARLAVDPGLLQAERLSMASNLAVPFKVLQASKQTINDRTVFNGTPFEKFQYMSHLVDTKTKIEACDNAIKQNKTKAVFHALRDRTIKEYVLDPKTLSEEKKGNKPNLADDLLTEAILAQDKQLIRKLKTKSEPFKTIPAEYYALAFNLQKPVALVALAPNEKQEEVITQQFLINDTDELHVATTYCQALEEIKKNDEQNAEQKIAEEKQKKDLIRNHTQLPLDLVEVITGYQEEDDDLAQAIRSDDREKVKELLNQGHSVRKSYRLSKTADRGDALELAAHCKAPAAFQEIMQQCPYIDEERQKKLKERATTVGKKTASDVEDLPANAAQAVLLSKVELLTLFITQLLPKHQQEQNQLAQDSYNMRGLLQALRKGADPNTRKNNAPLLKSFWYSQPHSKILLTFGANPHNVDAKGDPIIFSLGYNPVQMQMFLEHGANSNARDSNGNHILEQSGDECRALLLKHGANPNACDKNGDPIIFSLWNASKLKLFLKHGANPHARNGKKESLLENHVWSEERMRILLAHGADPNSFNKDGEPILFSSMAPECRKLLLRYGANPNARNKKGKSVLEDNRYDAEKMALLLEAGADPNGLYSNGKPPIADTYNSNLQHLLFIHGARRSDYYYYSLEPFLIAAIIALPCCYLIEYLDRQAQQ